MPEIRADLFLAISKTGMCLLASSLFLNVLTSRTVLAYKMDFWIFFCLQEPIIDVLVIFFVLKLEVYVRLVKSLLILSFHLSKQLKESPRTQNLEVIPL